MALTKNKMNRPCSQCSIGGRIGDLRGGIRYVAREASGLLLGAFR